MIFDYLDLELLEKDRKQEKAKLEEVKSKKEEIPFESKLRKKSFIIYEAGECYGKRITTNAEILIQQLYKPLKMWTGYSRSYNKDHSLKSEKVIIESVNFFTVLDETDQYIKSYLDFIKRDY